MVQDHGIHFGSLEHIDVLALLLLICYIVDDFFFLLFRLFILVSSFCFGSFCALICTLLFCLFLILCLIRVDLIDLKTFRKRQIFAVQILEQNVICHLFAEFVILQTAKLDEGTDIIPVLVILFLLGLAHTSQFIGNLLGNIIGDLLYKAVILQCASGYIQRQVRTVDHTL